MRGKVRAELIRLLILCRGRYRRAPALVAIHF
jgi:hypothetical protein